MCGYSLVRITITSKVKEDKMQACMMIANPELVCGSVGSICSSETSTMTSREELIW